MLRFFSVASFLAFGVIGIVLIVLDYHITLRAATELGKRSNLGMGKMLLETLKPQLNEMLSSGSAVEKAEKSFLISADIQKNIDILIYNIKILKINIYDAQGIIIFSTNKSEIRNNKSNNIRFKKAIEGKFTSRLLPTERCQDFAEDIGGNCFIIESYIPIRFDPAASVSGVFELYTDMAPWMEAMKDFQILLVISIIFILAMLYAVLIFIAYHAYKVIKRQRQTITEKSYLSSRILAAQEQERRRVAQELHDGIGQSVSAIKFYTEALLQQYEKSNAKFVSESLRKVIYMLKDTVEEIRRIGMALHPSTLDDLGVAATVEWFCRQFQYTYKHIRIDRTVDIDEHNLSESLKVAIYRIIQEALNNVATHSGGNHVHLGLMQRNHVVELTVDDNGKGFNLEKLGSENNTKVSFGIVGMKERVEVSGGSFAIESVLNRGTKISVRWLLTQ